MENKITKKEGKYLYYGKEKIGYYTFGYPDGRFRSSKFNWFAIYDKKYNRSYEDKGYKLIATEGDGGGSITGFLREINNNPKYKEILLFCLKNSIKFKDELKRKFGVCWI